ncbi:BadF/BadG/BcrA/BcrD ATPase family protein [Pullulanibacillus sp. KACC 23026]|uniref:N-acetylglucosamine kinase n=1 Tax=Pullulanibacillus sp. KACC 23026 TaxID=3028315 RepID=UPI0023AEB47D|nr:BadF/BadG/BcrA/BcrD ATPase family protein [Pullulanibacillus sp. KACC 23026]WEG14743.1 BadF/BadG/BcrA/BcrD ATPase family protein [Pullulanibacillus sp. KACC 23026]
MAKSLIRLMEYEKGEIPIHSQFIAIDGGGTKTDIVWFDETGHLLNRVIGKPSNLNSASRSEVKNHLRELFQKLVEEKTDFSNIKHVFGGFAGASHPKVQKELRSILSELLPRSLDLTINHDGINALWSGTHGQPGLVLLAGTGSLVFGVNDSRESFRVGGWGYLIGDEGSGYDMGRMAASSVMKAFDGRGSQTLLTSLILEYYDLAEETELIPLIYGHGKDALAQLAFLVGEAARSGDSVALEIFEKAINRLVGLIKAGLNKYESPPSEIFFVGGLKHLGDIFLGPLQDHIRQLSTDLLLSFPEAAPVYGAAVECLRLVGMAPPTALRKALAN